NPCTNSAYSSGTAVTTSTLSLSSGCVTGATSSMDSNLPTWIKNNFKCSVGYVQSTYYCFKSKNLLNARSPYYKASTGLNGGSGTPNPNFIANQNLLYAIPMTPAKNNSTLSGTQNGLASIGIAVNGLAIFNNAANPPDTLSTEASTFQQGHPEMTGSYHHHSQLINGDGTGGTPASVNLTTQGSSALIGIALDGYAIYGRWCGDATSGQNTQATGLDACHGHITTTPEFSTATYHYHYGGGASGTTCNGSGVGTGAGNDATAGIPTIMGSYFYGVIGQVSN
ncbi:MAG TPA: YHYH protein, partial [Leptospiraceae bacterium]|nr:YHYH protein [Leptospiraceae bacterium]